MDKFKRGGKSVCKAGFCRPHWQTCWGMSVLLAALQRLGKAGTATKDQCAHVHDNAAVNLWAGLPDLDLMHTVLLPLHRLAVPASRQLQAHRACRHCREVSTCSAVDATSCTPFSCPCTALPSLPAASSRPTEPADSAGRSAHAQQWTRLRARRFPAPAPPCRPCQPPAPGPQSLQTVQGGQHMLSSGLDFVHAVVLVPCTALPSLPAASSRPLEPVRIIACQLTLCARHGSSGRLACLHRKCDLCSGQQTFAAVCLLQRLSSAQGIP